MWLVIFVPEPGNIWSAPHKHVRRVHKINPDPIFTSYLQICLFIHIIRARKSLEVDPPPLGSSCYDVTSTEIVQLDHHVLNTKYCLTVSDHCCGFVRERYDLVYNYYCTHGCLLVSFGKTPHRLLERCPDTYKNNVDGIVINDLPLLSWSSIFDHNNRYNCYNNCLKKTSVSVFK